MTLLSCAYLPTILPSVPSQFCNHGRGNGQSQDSQTSSAATASFALPKSRSPACRMQFKVFTMSGNDEACSEMRVKLGCVNVIWSAGGATSAATGRWQLARVWLVYEAEAGSHGGQHRG